MFQGPEKSSFCSYREKRYRACRPHCHHQSTLPSPEAVIFQDGRPLSSFFLPCCVWQPKGLFFYSPQTILPELSEQYRLRAWGRRTQSSKNPLSYSSHFWKAMKSVAFSSISHACAENGYVRSSKHEKAMIIHRYHDRLRRRHRSLIGPQYPYHNWRSASDAPWPFLQKELSGRSWSTFSVWIHACSFFFCFAADRFFSSLGAPHLFKDVQNFRARNLA